MNILGCLDSPTSGCYLFGGCAVEGLPKEQRTLLRRHSLSFVFQGFNLLARTSALENVELPLLYQRVSRSERRDRACQALNAVGLLPWRHRGPNELSEDQRQRVAVARAIATNPRVLLADEPTGNLDSKASNEVMGLITELNRAKGITVVMVTHEPEMAAHADRIVTVLDGDIVSDSLRENRGAESVA